MAFSVITNIRVDLRLKLYHLHVTFVTRYNHVTRVGDCRGRTTELWRPANYSQFWGKTLEDGVRGRLGAAWPQPLVSEDTWHVTRGCHSVSDNVAKKWCKAQTGRHSVTCQVELIKQRLRYHISVVSL